MIYNFRIDRNGIPEILRRLRNEKMLSQGWGGGDKADLRIDRDDYVAECSKLYHLASTRIPTNLLRIRNFKDGDILVTPHLPETGKLSIHIVASDFPHCYDFLSTDPNHLNHRVKIKKSYGLEGNISIYNEFLTPWYAKLQWLRLPVLEIDQFRTIFSDIIDKLQRDPAARFDASELADYLRSQAEIIVNDLKKNLALVSPASGKISFESVCEYLLKSVGYTIVRRRHYDREGGDIDIGCTRARSDASVFESGDVRLFVQVKKHSGTSDEKGVQQLLRMIEKEPEADGCVMSLADGFTPEAEQLAKDNGIVLMTGDDICRQLLKVMFVGGE